MADRITLSLREPVQAHKAFSFAWERAKAGVYVIRCLANGRMYIGSSINVAMRLSRHRTLLRGGRHENSKLQRHFDKYGEDSFVFEPIEAAEPGQVLLAEQRWIDLLWDSGRLLNLQRVAGRPPSFHELSPDVRERKRKGHQSQIGRPASPKLIAILKERSGKNSPRYGKTNSESWKSHMRKAMAGERNPNFGKKGELSPLYGLKRSDETREKMRIAQQLRAKQGAPAAGAKACVCIDTSGRETRFTSARAAAKALGVGNTTVWKWCSGQRSPSDGSHWRFEP